MSAGSVWFSSEMKALSDDCECFISFPPGHLYSSKTGSFLLVSSLNSNSRSSDSCYKFLFCFPTVNLFLLSFLGSLRRWYNPPWFSEIVPSTPYDPLVLRDAFEKACALSSALYFTFVISDALHQLGLSVPWTIIDC
jgi:asparagine synthase (glutamine-hydrolysing)